MSLQPARRRWFIAPPGSPPLVLIATETALPEPDPDEDLLMEALAAAGLEPRLAAWDDPDVDWSAARLTVIRSTWDYHHRHETFLDWARRIAVQTTLCNPADAVAWNSHKRYLLDLAGAGVPVVPTELVPRDGPVRLAEIMSDRGWQVAVVKPAVSASSYRTLRVDHANLDQGEAHLRDVLAGRDALVQPYIPSVEDYGERALIWIDGEFTHAVRKSPRFAADDESVSGALPPAPDELDVARAALAQVRGPLLYGRVDLAPDVNGLPVVMEMELIEPSLYLLQSPAALDRLVSAIASRVGAPPLGPPGR
ncbi:MAG TPA: hypothetical protein VLS25_12235 [Dehalococcoidia bacterium]|nr:hypothetical protein [Dehalococcoidia bacterium]